MIDLMTNQLSNRNSDKFIPHPILDDPKRTLRIIANPVYDKLTISRAAQLRQYFPTHYKCESVLLNRPKNKSAFVLKQLPTAGLPMKNESIRTNSVSQSPKLPKSRQTTPMILDQTITIDKPSSTRQRSNSTHSTSIKDDKKSIVDNNAIRYVHSNYGFEVHRYSSDNWLSADVLSKEACEKNERTFREMLKKQQQEEVLSHSIYTSEYYRKRWQDSVKSYKQGCLTHRQWAKQNYELYCLKTYYEYACQREKFRIDLSAQKQRRKRAQHAFNEWQKSKVGDYFERSRSLLNHTETISTNSHRPASHLNTTNNNDISNIPSTSSEHDESLNNCSMHSSKSSTNKMDLLDEKRWSLEAMVKRIVGLAEPLSPTPKITNVHSSSLINPSNNSGFDSTL